MADWSLRIASENGVILYVEGEQLIEQNSQIMALCDRIQLSPPTWIQELLPSYRSVLVLFDPYAIDHLGVKAWLRTQLNDLPPRVEGSVKQHRIPVLYGAKQTPDLAHVAKANGLSEQQVIELHCQQNYRVFALGFSPGFGFLGEVDERIATPRLATPRQQVPTGAVAIADKQTAIYPTTSPGGWNLIGLCPVPMFNKYAESPCRLAVGDEVVFYPVTPDHFDSIRRENCQ